ncbi:hypothetical protein B0H12DRAFT_1238237 [Mycena haematopus]|nr:hypothetical protein B0H12DRAFT_1238237 [Mycena haematopus]
MTLGVPNGWSAWSPGGSQFHSPSRLVSNAPKEFQVQVLLYLLKLSLPGPPEVPSPSKKRRKIGEPPAPSTEDRLEAFMDKLPMWQLVNPLDKGLLASRALPWFGLGIVKPRSGAIPPA